MFAMEPSDIAALRAVRKTRADYEHWDERDFQHEGWQFASFFPHKKAQARYRFPDSGTCRSTSDSECSLGSDVSDGSYSDDPEVEKCGRVRIYHKHVHGGEHMGNESRAEEDDSVYLAAALFVELI